MHSTIKRHSTVVTSLFSRIREKKREIFLGQWGEAIFSYFSLFHEMREITLCMNEKKYQIHINITHS